jgi:hypothetical protein
MFRTMIGSVAAAAAVLAAGPAVAGGPPGGYGGGSAREPEVRLTLSYMADAGYAAAVKLDCEPVGGGHPQGEPACATLAAAGGDPERIPPARTMCFLIYAPIVAEMSGQWHGKAIEWRHRYGNG